MHYVTMHVVHKHSHVHTQENPDTHTHTAAATIFNVSHSHVDTPHGEVGGWGRVPFSKI